MPWPSCKIATLLEMPSELVMVHISVGIGLTGILATVGLSVPSIRSYLLASVACHHRKHKKTDHRGIQENECFQHKPPQKKEKYFTEAEQEPPVSQKRE